MIRIAVENHIPYIKGALEPFAEVLYLSAEGFTREIVDDVDAIIVRTRTRCDERLLSGGRCRFVGTATIGTDHIDIGYCQSHGIMVANAPGCNAPAVAQYVHATIALFLSQQSSLDPEELTLGIVGVGHVGSIVERWARMLDYRVLLCDPPRARLEGDSRFVELGEIASQADVITFHTPLTTAGPDATYHICGEDFLRSLARCKLLINSARGPVTDTQSLISALDNGQVGSVVIDCWENEPCISTELLSRAFVATPHIAGYSAEGKMRATSMVVDAINKHFGLDAVAQKPATPLLGAERVTMEGILSSYNPMTDTAALKALSASGNLASGFESLRNHYDLRHEVE